MSEELRRQFYEKTLKQFNGAKSFRGVAIVETEYDPDPEIYGITFKLENGHIIEIWSGNITLSWPDCYYECDHVKTIDMNQFTF